jgi:SHAQKYF class myb-like DNA-binding protein
LDDLGSFRSDELLNFYLGLKLYGRDWKKIEALVGTRNGAQIRSHAQKFFTKMDKSDENKSNDSKFFFFDVIFDEFLNFICVYILTKTI